MARSGALHVVNGIVAGVRAELVEHLRVVVAYRSYVELLCPSGLGIHYCKVVKGRAAEFVQFKLVRVFSVKYFLEYQLDFGIGIVAGVEGLESVVGKLAAH